MKPFEVGRLVWLLQVEVVDLVSQASNNVAGSSAGTAAATQQMSRGALGATPQMTLLPSCQTVHLH